MIGRIRSIASLIAVSSFAVVPAVRGAAPSPADRDAWITIGEPAFATVTDLFSDAPGADVLPFLPRVAVAAGVVLTRIPESAIDLLSERVHRDLGHCGGFVRHASLADGLAELARLENPPAPLVLPFAVDRPDLVTPLVAAIDEATILATINSLSTSFPNRYRNQPFGTSAANAIKAMWEGYASGRPEITVALYPHPEITQPSVILTIPGTTLPDEIVVIGGHEDSTSSGCSSNPNCSAPGADDDASGIATISEALRVFLAAGIQPQRTLQFMAFAGEEGGLIGSDDIAGDYADAGEQVVAMLQQDMTAYQGSATDITVIQDAAYTSTELITFVVGLLDAYLPTLTRGNSSCGYACSDHASWNTRGYPAALAFEAPFPGSDNPFIHTPNDTVANFGGSAAHAAKFARIAVAFAVEAAIDFEPDIFADGFESEDVLAWSLAVP